MWDWGGCGGGHHSSDVVLNFLGYFNYRGNNALIYGVSRYWGGHLVRSGIGFITIGVVVVESLQDLSYLPQHFGQLFSLHAV